MTERLANKLLIIGWDAADWFMIDPLLSVGAMPNLAKLVEHGVRADLSTLEPRLSPLLWTSIATGKTADKHGILNFIEPDPQGAGVRVASRTSRKTKALWNILTQSNLKVNVIGWYASHPAEPINGVCVSNLFLDGVPDSPRQPWPMLKGAVHPESRAAAVAALRMHPNSLADSELLPLIPKLREIPRNAELLKHLKKHLAQTISIHNVATSLLSDPAAAADCTMVFHEAIDTIGHHFMEFHPPKMPHVSTREFDWYQHVMNGVYQIHDMMLGRLLELAGPETAVILLSDHGFYSDHLRPVTRNLSQMDRAALEAAWHRPTGVLVMCGEPFKRADRAYGASVLDVTPTALSLLGLPISHDMDGRILTETFNRTVIVESLLSWDLKEGAAGQHSPDVRQDPFEAHDAIKQLVDLGYLAALPADRQQQLELVRRETRFNLAVIYLTTARPQKAIPVFQELAEAYPNEPRFATGLGRCLMMVQQLDQCIAVMRKFLEQQPDNIESRLLLAGALASAQQHEPAAAELERLKVSCQGRTEMNAPLGDICSILERWDEAAEFYKQAAAADPTNIHVILGLARCALGAGRFEEAVEHSLNAVEIKHVMPEAHHILGVALTWLQDFPNAIQSFKIALSMAPGMLDSHRYLASIHRHLGDREQASHHRNLAEKLVGEFASGSVSPEFLKREAPMGPLAWSRHVGIDP